MKILGLGVPEMLLSFSFLIIPLAFLAVLYFVVKSAVKRGMIEARAEIKRVEAAQIPLPPIQNQ